MQGRDIQPQQSIAIVPNDVIINMQSQMDEMLREVSKLKSVLEASFAQPHKDIKVAPAFFELSLSDVATIIGKSKSTVERMIISKNLPVPRKQEHNNYRFYKKEDLPIKMHSAIDLFYSEKIKASR